MIGFYRLFGFALAQLCVVKLPINDRGSGCRLPFALEGAIVAGTVQEDHDVDVRIQVRSPNRVLETLFCLECASWFSLGWGSAKRLLVK